LQKNAKNNIFWKYLDIKQINAYLYNMRTIFGLIAGYGSLLFQMAILLILLPFILILLPFALFAEWSQKQLEKMEKSQKQENFPRLTKEELEKIDRIIFMRSFRR